MSNIDPYINQIQTAVYGEEVRGSICAALQQCYTDATHESSGVEDDGDGIIITVSQ